MITKEEIKKFVDEQIESADYAEDFSELDSLEKVELLLTCEQEYVIGIGEDEIKYIWSTDEFVDYLYNKINEKN